MRCRCTLKQAGATAAYVAMLTTILLLTVYGYLQALALAVGALGAWGHLIFVVLVIFAGQPWAWGFSVITQAAGFTFRWLALPTMEVGTFLGAVVGFYSSRFCCRKWVARKVEAFPEDAKLLADAARSEVSSCSTRSNLVFFLLRTTPLLTFGLVNAISGALTDMRLPFYLWTVLLGTQIDLVLNVYIGTVLREVADRVKDGVIEQHSTAANYSTAPSSSSDGVGGDSGASLQAEASVASDVALGLQIASCVVILVVTTVWSRKTLKKVVLENKKQKRSRKAEEEKNTSDKSITNNDDDVVGAADHDADTGLKLEGGEGGKLTAKVSPSSSGDEMFPTIVRTF